MKVEVQKRVYKAQLQKPGSVIVSVQSKRYQAQNQRTVINATVNPLLSKVAGANLSGHKVLCVKIDGKAYYADSSTLNTSGIIGISTEAVSINQAIRIQTSGELQHSGWSFTIGEPVWCGANGALTQSPSGSAFICVVGMAIATDTINIEVQQPIIVG